MKIQAKPITIDPGRNLSWCWAGSLIPTDRWHEVNLVLITNGHPDHFDCDLAISEASRAEIVCEEGLESRYHRQGFCPIVLRPGERVQYQGINLLGAPGGTWALVVIPDGVMAEIPIFGAGSVGYLIDISGMKVPTLGDTKILNFWRPLKPHVFLAPIGDKVTLKASEALTVPKILVTFKS